ncbi:hypothetical protein VTN02DRAFT_5641 [Thermoascus thermophilus]
MCDHIQVNYRCGHHRFLVTAWCTIYARTGKICPLNVVTIEDRIDEICSMCLAEGLDGFLFSSSGCYATGLDKDPECKGR